MEKEQIQEGKQNAMIKVKSEPQKRTEQTANTVTPERLSICLRCSLVQEKYFLN